MPPKAKVTREMILQTVFQITREQGFEAVNARSIAESLNCSTALFLPVMKIWRS